jgi:hypothetical protein
MTGPDDRADATPCDSGQPARGVSAAFARFFGLGVRDRAGPDPLRDPVFAVLTGYWQAVRDDRAMPLRTDLDPRGLANVLDRVMLLDRIAPGVLRIATAGQRLQGWFGGVAAGLPLSLLFDPASREDVAALVDPALRHGKPVDLRLRGASGHALSALVGRHATEARLLLLPLADAHGIGAGFVAGFAADRSPPQGRDDRTAFRLVTAMPHAVPDQAQAADRRATSTPAAFHPAAFHPATPAFAEDPAQWDGPQRPAARTDATRRPRLQVIKGNRRA